ncbi:MAG: hypothetical protein AAGG01_20835, partial [Planctomycetota bacterium]
MFRRLDPPPSPPARSALAQGLFRLWLLNVLVGALVGSLWFFDAPADRAPWIRFYVSLALVSSRRTP